MRAATGLLAGLLAMAIIPVPTAAPGAVAAPAYPEAAPGWVRSDPYSWNRTDIDNPALDWIRLDAHRWTRVTRSAGL